MCNLGEVDAVYFAIGHGAGDPQQPGGFLLSDGPTRAADGARDLAPDEGEARHQQDQRARRRHDFTGFEESS